MSHVDVIVAESGVEQSTSHTNLQSENITQVERVSGKYDQLGNP